MPIGRNDTIQFNKYLCCAYYVNDTVLRSRMGISPALKMLITVHRECQHTNNYNYKRRQNSPWLLFHCYKLVSCLLCPKRKQNKTKTQTTGALFFFWSELHPSLLFNAKSLKEFRILTLFTP